MALCQHLHDDLHKPKRPNDRFAAYSNWRDTKPIAPGQKGEV